MTNDDKLNNIKAYLEMLTMILELNKDKDKTFIISKLGKGQESYTEEELNNNIILEDDEIYDLIILNIIDYVNSKIKEELNNY